MKLHSECLRPELSGCRYYDSPVSGAKVDQPVCGLRVGKIQHSSDYRSRRRYEWDIQASLGHLAFHCIIFFSAGNILMGFKGPDFWDAGYVWAPYQSLYMSPKDQRADLSTRQAFAMRYGKKRINTAMYKKILIN